MEEKVHSTYVKKEEDCISLPPSKKESRHKEMHEDGGVIKLAMKMLLIKSSTNNPISK